MRPVICLYLFRHLQFQLKCCAFPFVHPAQPPFPFEIICLTQLLLAFMHIWRDGLLE